MIPLKSPPFTLRQAQGERSISQNLVRRRPFVVSPSNHERIYDTVFVVTRNK
jgi:hypothetical protein